MAALNFGSHAAVVERSPFDSIWLEQDGIFAESAIWKEYQKEKKLISPETIKQGEMVISCLLYTSPSPRD